MPLETERKLVEVSESCTVLKALLAFFSGRLIPVWQSRAVFRHDEYCFTLQVQIYFCWKARMTWDRQLTADVILQVRHMGILELLSLKVIYWLVLLNKAVIMMQLVGRQVLHAMLMAKETPERAFRKICIPRVVGERICKGYISAWNCIPDLDSQERKIERRKWRLKEDLAQSHNCLMPLHRI